MAARQQLRGCLGRRHISDQQSFPFESKKRPKLWDGAWSLEERYTQLEKKYAPKEEADPEFDWSTLD